MNLICTVGLPMSGKTTWARATGWPVITPDLLLCGLAGGLQSTEKYRSWAPTMWTATKMAVIEHGRRQEPFVILDSTGTDHQKRTMFREWGQEAGACVYFMVFYTPKDVCRERLLDAKRRPDLLYLEDHVEHMRHLSVDLRPTGFTLPLNPGIPFEGILRG